MCDNVHILTSSDLQFGFKPKHSTTQCTFVLNEIIDYYLRHDSSIYLVLLDASQAFDRVQYVKMFRLLIQRGICSLTARLLANMYTNQSLRVCWNGQISNPFTISNGVKQGAILSPILFCIYMDVLLLELKKSKFGCHIGSTFCGSFGYADDVCILAPSHNAIQSMLNVCQNFAAEYDVKCNASKSQLLLFNCPANVKDIELSNIPIQVSESGVHLGHHIGKNCNYDSISKGISDLVYRTNYVTAKFGFCNSLIKSHMFDTYCTSFYGCPLWNMKTSYINRFCVNWRKCVRRIWGVPWMTHGTILKHLMREQGQSIKTQLFSRFLSFYYGVVHSDNKYVNMCSSLCTRSNTNVASNLRLLLHALNNNGDCFTDSSVLSIRRKLYSSSFCSDECTAVGMCVRELCLMRDGYYLPAFNQCSLITLLHDLCVN